MTDDIAILRRDLDTALAQIGQLKEALRVTNAALESGRQHTESLTSLRKQLRTAFASIRDLAHQLKSRARDDQETFTRIVDTTSQIADALEKDKFVENSGARSDVQPSTATPARTPADGLFKVLCVEDNPMSLGLIQQIFTKRPNFKLFTTNSGKTVLPLARQCRPGVILLDLNLPDMHGGDVLQTLREDEATKNVPVVVISADAAPSQIERLLAAGARNYVTKPFDFGRFLYIMDEIAADYAGKANIVALHSAAAS